MYFKDGQGTQRGKFYIDSTVLTKISVKKNTKRQHGPQNAYISFSYFINLAVPKCNETEYHTFELYLKKFPRCHRVLILGFYNARPTYGG